jgi:hypothetical protein
MAWLTRSPPAHRETHTGGLAFIRHLAILVDGRIMTAPSLRAAIRSDAVITGNFSRKAVDNLVSILRAGALPARCGPSRWWRCRCSRSRTGEDARFLLHTCRQ